MLRQKKKQLNGARTSVSAMCSVETTALITTPHKADRDVRAPFGVIPLTKIKRFLLTGLLLAFSFNLAVAQKNANNQLAEFEKNIEQGKFEETERPLLDYAIAHPNDAQALSLLARLRYRQNRFEEAAGLNKRVLTLDPNLAAAKINLALVTFKLGRADEARQILSEFDQTSPIAPVDQLNLADTLFLIGEFQKALKTTENLPLKLKNNDALPIIAACNLELGDRQKFNELIPLIKIAAAGNVVLAVRLAEILQTAGMKPEAMDLLRRALATAPNNASILILIGRFEVFAGEFAQARQHLNRAAALTANSPEVLSAQALLENYRGNRTAAFALLDKARGLAPNSTAILADYVLTAIKINQSQNAVDAARKLIELKQTEPEFRYLLGAALLQNGNISSAQEVLERFVKERPNDGRGCLALGLTLATQSDRLEAARNQLAHCLEIDPTNYEARYQLGLSYKTQGETAKAIELLAEVTRQAPDYAAALRDLGALYVQTGAEKQARAALERAAMLNAQDADTHFQLSRLYNLTGETALAKRHLEMFQKLKNTGAKSVQ